MLADTHAIRTFGHAGSGQATELAAIAATVSSLPVAAAAPMFGSVGARFLAALADAAAAESASVAALSRHVGNGALTAQLSAEAYTAADLRAAGRLAGPTTASGR